MTLMATVRLEALAGRVDEGLMARVGAETSRIRIGSGGIMLPHYSPLKVAENFRLCRSAFAVKFNLHLFGSAIRWRLENLAFCLDSVLVRNPANLLPVQLGGLCNCDNVFGPSTGFQKTSFRRWAVPAPVL
jgi:hypothetical protein